MTRPLMPIRWNLTPNGSWETTVRQILLTRSLGLAGGSVSIAISLPRYQSRTAELIHRSVILLVGPGLNVAQTSLWIACAMSLAVFNIEKYVDEFGNAVEHEIRYTNGMIR